MAKPFASRNFIRTKTPQAHIYSKYQYVLLKICQIIDESASSHGISIIFWPVETGYFDNNRCPAVKDSHDLSIYSQHVNRVQ